MCELCERLATDESHRQRIVDIYNKISERIKATKREPVEAEGVVAFTTMPFPLMTFAIFEPRMALQLPSNFYQSMVVDGAKLRSDWASGWLRLVGFSNGSLYLLTAGHRTKETREYLLHLHMVEFAKEEWSVAQEGAKITISVNNVKKNGINLLSDQPAEHTYSFSFVHQPTEHSFMPRDRVESSALVKSAYHGKLPQKPLAFDWSQYVVTVPHFAPHGIIHQNYKSLGYSSAIEMQHAVTGMLRAHLGLPPAESKGEA